jgi:hypothetical protein
METRAAVARAGGTIGEWGFLQRVSSGLYIWSLGAADLAGPFLDTAQMPMLPTSARRP